VPLDWPVSLMSTFLARSFRRNLHVEYEGKIIKNISVGQNLETKLSTWPILREEGAIVEEEGEDEEYDPDEKSEGKGESRSFNEKAALEGKLEVEISAADIVPEPFEGNRTLSKASERPTRPSDDSPPIDYHHPT